MCGIFGLINLESSKLDNFQKNKAFLYQGYAVTSVLRGLDSSGLIAVKKNEAVEYYKKAWSGLDFIYDKKANEYINNIDKFTFFVGHVRAATRGRVSVINAHPFQHGHITLVHNGTLKDQVAIDPHKKFDVDSEAIAYNISVEGYEKTIPKLNGAFVLVWWDDKEQKMFFTRNDERPLFFAKSKEKKIIYFASEKEILKLLMDRNGIAIDEDYNMWTIPPGEVYYYSIDQDTITATKKTVDLYKAPVHNVPVIGYNSLEYKREEQLKAELLNKYGITAGINISYTPDYMTNTNTYHSKGNHDSYGYLAESFDNIMADKNIEVIIKSYGKFNEISKFCKKTVFGRITSIFLQKDTLAINVTDIDFIEKIKDKKHVDVYDAFYGIFGTTDPMEDSLVQGPANSMITRERFYELVKHGCCYCEDAISIMDAKEITWVGLGPLCKECKREGIL